MTTPAAPTPVHVDERARSMRRAMVAALRDAGELTDAAVTEALAAEPRHLYVPVFYRRCRDDAGGGWFTERVDAGHPSWLPEVHADQALVTMLRDGTDGPPLSSSTAPSLMAAMLQSLAIEAGMNVLEVGTGTGYNAGLLARLAGDAHVTTIDIEPAIIDTARAALAAAGHPAVRVLCGDGADLRGEPGSVDRIIATCGLTTVPDGWRVLVRPGGRIVAPIGAGIAAIDVDGESGASGRFLPTGAYFMGLRSAVGAAGVPFPGEPDDAPTGRCAMPLAAWADNDFRFPVSLALPDLMSRGGPDDPELVAWHGDGSIARIRADGAAQQAGPRRLADALGALWIDFQAAGRPPRDRYGVTISPEGRHTAWRDTPDTAHSWQLGTPQQAMTNLFSLNWLEFVGQGVGNP